MLQVDRSSVGHKENIEHKVHGKCVCEACNCGRHHCPDPIKHGQYYSSYSANYLKHEGFKPEGKHKMIHKNFILPNDKFYGESSYLGDYHKKENSEPQQKFVPKGEIQLSRDPFSAHSSYIDDYLNRGTGQRATPTKHPNNQILPEGHFDGGSNYASNFVGSPSKRPDQFRPVGQLKTGDGNFEGTSSYNSDYEKRGMGMKAERVPLPKNQIMPEGRFEGHSIYADNYIPSKGERLQQIRPEGQIKVGGNFEGASSYNADYASRGPGVKAQKAIQPNNKFMPEGKFQGYSSYADNYIPSKGERLQQIRPEGQIKVGGNFEGASSYNADYASRGPGIKADKVIIPNNQILPQGQFSGDSEYHQTFIKGQAERAKQLKRDGELKVGGEPFVGASSYIQDYLNRGSGIKSERVPLPKNIVIPEGKFQGDSSYHESYLNNKAQRLSAVRPEGQLKVGEGKFEGNSSYGADYLKVKGEKAAQFRPNGQLKVGQGKFEGKSTYGDNYLNTGSRIKEKCPCDELQAPRTQVVQEDHVRYNSVTHKWE